MEEGQSQVALTKEKQKALDDLFSSGDEQSISPISIDSPSNENHADIDSRDLAVKLLLPPTTNTQVATAEPSSTKPEADSTMQLANTDIVEPSQQVCSPPASPSLEEVCSHGGYALYKPLSPWNNELFRYNKFGELEADIKFDTLLLHEYIYTHPLGKDLVMWVQMQPANSEEIYHEFNSYCRSKTCDGWYRSTQGLIEKGSYRITMDEIYGRDQNHKANPWVQAAFFHVHCFERMISIPDLIHEGSNIFPDKRQFITRDGLGKKHKNFQRLDDLQVAPAADEWFTKVKMFPDWRPPNENEKLNGVLWLAKIRTRRHRRRNVQVPGANLITYNREYLAARPTNSRGHGGKRMKGKSVREMIEIEDERKKIVYGDFADLDNDDASKDSTCPELQINADCYVVQNPSSWNMANRKRAASTSQENPQPPIKRPRQRQILCRPEHIESCMVPQIGSSQMNYAVPQQTSNLIPFVQPGVLPPSVPQVFNQAHGANPLYIPPGFALVPLHHLPYLGPVAPVVSSPLQSPSRIIPNVAASSPTYPSTPSRTTPITTSPNPIYPYTPFLVHSNVPSMQHTPLSRNIISPQSEGSTESISELINKILGRPLTPLAETDFRAFQQSTEAMRATQVSPLRNAESTGSAEQNSESSP